MTEQTNSGDKSNQATVNKYVAVIRQKLADKKPKRGYFSTSHLRKLAAKRRLLATQQMNVEVA
jgi:hypothetical protein